VSSSGVVQVYVAKAARVFYSGTLSILIPQYILALGYSELLVGLALVAILAGNVASNLSVTWLEARVGKRRLLQAFSLLIVASGLVLVSSGSAAAILIGCFLGNISTTGTEAGPFQSIEAGVLPDLAGGKAAEAFGKYNLIGYGASAAGALAAGSPGVIPGGLDVYRGLFAGFSAAGVLLFLVYSTLRSPRFSERTQKPGFQALGEGARKDLTRLSMLFSVDAFGGSFVSQYVLSTYFLLAYGVTSEGLGEIFFATSVIVAFSVYIAARLAGRLGNLRTMVYTHLASNAFLIAIPLAGSLAASLAFLFVRQSMSQMDVPTRQALMAEMFSKDERVTAFALSNTARSVATFAGGPVGTAFLASGFLSGLLLAGGFSKVAYDLAIFLAYRKRFR
jgi:MFS family permease